MGEFTFNELTETILPFMSAITAAKIFGVIVILVVAVYIVRSFVYKHSLNFRRGPTAEVFYTVICCLMSTALYTFFYWQWALPMSVVLALAFMSAVSHEVKEGNADERCGVYGLNKDIRSVRADIFNEMTVEEQIEYTKGVKEYKFYRIRFIAICVAVPLLTVTAFYFLDIGFLWFPVEL